MTNSLALLLVILPVVYPLTCPVGHQFARHANQSVYCKPCDPGEYYATSMTDENGWGNYKWYCDTCPVKTYQPASGSTGCLDCLPGNGTNSYGRSSSCTICPSGTFSNQYSGQCENCPVNQYNPSKGRTEQECIACPPGHASPGGPVSISIANCTRCGPGTYPNSGWNTLNDPAGTCARCSGGTVSVNGYACTQQSNPFFEQLIALDYALSIYASQFYHFNPISDGSSKNRYYFSQGYEFTMSQVNLHPLDNTELGNSVTKFTTMDLGSTSYDSTEIIPSFANPGTALILRNFKVRRYNLTAGVPLTSSNDALGVSGYNLIFDSKRGYFYTLYVPYLSNGIISSYKISPEGNLTDLESSFSLGDIFPNGCNINNARIGGRNSQESYGFFSCPSSSSTMHHSLNFVRLDLAAAAAANGVISKAHFKNYTLVVPREVSYCCGDISSSRMTTDDTYAYYLLVNRSVVSHDNANTAWYHHVVRIKYSTMEFAGMIPLQSPNGAWDYFPTAIETAGNDYVIVTTADFVTIINSTSFTVLNRIGRPTKVPYIASVAITTGGTGSNKYTLTALGTNARPQGNENGMVQSLFYRVPIVSCPPGKVFAINETLRKWGECVTCPSSTYAKETMPYCDKCKSGEWSPQGSDRCIQCPSGYARPAAPGNSSSDCIICGVGSFAAAGSASCTPCPMGWYSIGLEGAAPGICRPCGAGFELPLRGTSNESGTLPCQACKPGYYAPTTGTPMCLACPANTYSSNYQSTACTPCPSGTFSGPGANTCDAPDTVSLSVPDAFPTSMTMDAASGDVYVAYAEKNMIAYFGASNLGGALNSQPKLFRSMGYPSSLVYSNVTKLLYFTDSSTGQIKSLDPIELELVTLARNLGTRSTGSGRRLADAGIAEIVVDAGNNYVYTLESKASGSRILAISTTDKVTLVTAGVNTGTVINANPMGLALINTNNGKALLFGDGGNKVLMILLANDPAPLLAPVVTWFTLSNANAKVQKIIGSLTSSNVIILSDAGEVTTVDAINGTIIGSTVTLAAGSSINSVLINPLNGQWLIANGNTGIVTAATVCTNGNTFQPCTTTCNPGQYSKVDGTCASCAVGSSQSLSGQAVCPKCLPGSYASSTGATSCTICSPGTGHTLYGQTASSACVACTPGYFSNANGVCTKCPYGQISLASASSCFQCPPGSQSSDDGTMCELCPPNHANPSYGGRCQPCAGTTGESYNYFDKWGTDLRASVPAGSAVCGPMRVNEVCYQNYGSYVCPTYSNVLYYDGVTGRRYKNGAYTGWTTFGTNFGSSAYVWSIEQSRVGYAVDTKNRIMYGIGGNTATTIVPYDMNANSLLATVNLFSGSSQNPLASYMGNDDYMYIVFKNYVTPNMTINSKVCRVSLLPTIALTGNCVAYTYLSSVNDLVAHFYDTLRDILYLISTQSTLSLVRLSTLTLLSETNIFEVFPSIRNPYSSFNNANNQFFVDFNRQILFHVSDNCPSYITPFNLTSLTTIVVQNRLTDSTFSPTSISGCSVWLDANDTSTLTLSNSSIVQWDDKSGNTKHAVSNSSDPASNPTYVANSLNGQGTVRFDGFIYPQFLDIPAFSFGTTGRSAFFVLQNTVNAGSGNAYLPHWLFPGAGFSPTGTQPNAGESHLAFKGWLMSSNHWVVNNNVNNLRFNKYFVIEYRFGATSGKEEVYINGILYGTFTKTGGGYTDALYGYRLGWLTGRPITTTADYIFNFDGNMAEVILYNRAVTDAEQDKINDYLAYKWGIEKDFPNVGSFVVNTPSTACQLIKTNDVKKSQASNVNEIRNNLLPLIQRTTGGSFSISTIDVTDPTNMTLTKTYNTYASSGRPTNVGDFTSLSYENSFELDFETLNGQIVDNTYLYLVYNNHEPLHYRFTTTPTKQSNIFITASSVSAYNSLTNSMMIFTDDVGWYSGWYGANTYFQPWTMRGSNGQIQQFLVSSEGIYSDIKRVNPYYLDNKDQGFSFRSCNVDTIANLVYCGTSSGILSRLTDTTPNFISNYTNITTDFLYPDPNKVWSASITVMLRVGSGNDAVLYVGTKPVKNGGTLYKVVKPYSVSGITVTSLSNGIANWDKGYTCGFINSANTFAYFFTNDVPSKVVIVDLSTFTMVGSATALASTVGTITSVVYDPVGNKAYVLSTLGVSVYNVATNAISSTNPVTIPNGVIDGNITSASKTVGGVNSNLIAFGILGEAIIFDISSTLTLASRAIYTPNNRYVTNLEFIGTSKEKLMATFSSSRQNAALDSSIGAASFSTVLTIVDTNNLCPTGKSWSTLSNACVDCPTGSYDEDSRSCIACPAGTYGVVKGGIFSGVCKPCGKGTYSSSGSTICTPCNPGTYNDVLGAQQCKSCAVSKYNPDSGSQDIEACLSCPSGHACNSLGLAKPKICLPGTVAGAGATACTACGANTYTNTKGRSSCTACPIAWLAAGTGNIDCTPCPAGTYGNQYSPGSCFNVNPGFYAPTPGTFGLISCPAGTFNTGWNNINCTLCPENYQQVFTGQTSCSACPNGQISKPGSATCSLPATSCSAGKYLSNGYCLTCTPNNICTGGTTQPQACPNGQIPNTGTNTSCFTPQSSCNPGEYLSNQQCIVCPIGSYCTGGTSGTTVCPSGFTTPGNQSASSADCSVAFCAAGNYKVNNTCVNCAPNSYAAGGLVTSCTKCPANGTTTIAAPASVSDCNPGPSTPEITLTSMFINGAGWSNNDFSISTTTACANKCRNSPNCLMWSVGGGYCVTVPESSAAGISFSNQQATSGVFLGRILSTSVLAKVNSVIGTATSCNPGKTLANGICYSCPYNSVCSGGTSAPSTCQSGYIPNSGQTACTLAATSCDPGKYLDNGVCSECLTYGSYFCVGGGTSWQSCPSGLVPTANSSACEAPRSSCEPGQYLDTSRCKRCPKAVRISQMQIKHGDFKKPALGYDYICPGGTATATLCVMGTVGSANQTVCIQGCNEGNYLANSPSYNLSNGETILHEGTCTTCPVGKACFGNLAPPIDCPASTPGGFSWEVPTTTTGNAFCRIKQVPAGFYISNYTQCAANTQQPMRCPTGYTCPGGTPSTASVSVTSTSCAPGTFLWPGTDCSDMAADPTCTFASWSYSNHPVGTCTTTCPFGAYCPGNLLPDRCGCSAQPSSDGKVCQSSGGGGGGGGGGGMGACSGPAPMCGPQQLVQCVGSSWSCVSGTTCPAAPPTCPCGNVPGCAVTSWICVAGGNNPCGGGGGGGCTGAPPMCTAPQLPTCSNNVWSCAAGGSPPTCTGDPGACNGQRTCTTSGSPYTCTTFPTCPVGGYLEYSGSPSISSTCSSGTTSCPAGQYLTAAVVSNAITFTCNACPSGYTCDGGVGAIALSTTEQSFSGPNPPSCTTPGDSIVTTAIQPGTFPIVGVKGRCAKRAAAALPPFTPAISCPAGKYRSSLNCIPCPVGANQCLGEYRGISIIVNNNNNNNNNGPADCTSGNLGDCNGETTCPNSGGAITCTPYTSCPAGKILSGSICSTPPNGNVSCAPGEYLFITGSNYASSTFSCLPCPSGHTCAGGIGAVALSTTSQVFNPSVNPNPCPNVGDTVFVTGYTGTTYYGRTPATLKCGKSPVSPTNQMLALDLASLHISCPVGTFQEKLVTCSPCPPGLTCRGGYRQPDFVLTSSSSNNNNNNNNNPPPDCTSGNVGDCNGQAFCPNPNPNSGGAFSCTSYFSCPVGKFLSSPTSTICSSLPNNGNISCAPGEYLQMAGTNLASSTVSCLPCPSGYTCAGGVGAVALSPTTQVFNPTVPNTCPVGDIVFISAFGGTTMNTLMPSTIRCGRDPTTTNLLKIDLQDAALSCPPGTFHERFLTCSPCPPGSTCRGEYRSPDIVLSGANSAPSASSTPSNTPTPSSTASAAPPPEQDVLIPYLLSSSDLCASSNVANKFLDPSNGIAVNLRYSMGTSLGYSGSDAFVSGLVVCDGTYIPVDKDAPINTVKADQPFNGTVISSDAPRRLRRLYNMLNSLSLPIDGTTVVVELGVAVPAILAPALTNLMVAMMTNASSAEIQALAANLTATMATPEFLAMYPVQQGPNTASALPPSLVGVISTAASAGNVPSFTTALASVTTAALTPIIAAFNITNISTTVFAEGIRGGSVTTFSNNNNNGGGVAPSDSGSSGGGSGALGALVLIPIALGVVFFIIWYRRRKENVKLVKAKSVEDNFTDGATTKTVDLDSSDSTMVVQDSKDVKVEFAPTGTDEFSKTNPMTKSAGLVIRRTEIQVNTQ